MCVCVCDKNCMFTERRSIARWVSPTLRELKRRRDRVERWRTGPAVVRPRSGYLDWNYEAELSAVGPRIGEPALRPDVLCRALTDPSYRHTHTQEQEDNSELVVSGDKFLVAYIDRWLSEHLPAVPQDARGALSDYVLRAECVANMAQQMGVSDLVRCAVSSRIHCLNFIAYEVVRIYRTMQDQSLH